MPNSANIYIVYDPKDQLYLEALEVQMDILKQQGIIHIWSIDKVPAGAVIETIRLEQLGAADLVIALVSADYLASEECQRTQQEAFEQGKPILPVILRACLWQHDSVLKSLQPVPFKNGILKEVNQWNHPDEAFASVANRILGLISGDQAGTRLHQFSPMNAENPAFTTTSIAESKNILHNSQVSAGGNVQIGDQTSGDRVEGDKIVHHHHYVDPAPALPRTPKYKNRVRNLLLILGALIAIFAIVYVQFGPESAQSEAADYQKAIEQNSIPALEAFRKKYPNGAYSPAVQPRIDSFNRVLNDYLESARALSNGGETEAAYEEWKKAYQINPGNDSVIKLSKKLKK